MPYDVQGEIQSGHRDNHRTQLLFNSNPSAPSENHLETSRKKPLEAIGRTQSSVEGAPLPYKGWRNPNYQELRYVYVRDKIILDHEGVSCGTPGATRICLGDPDEYMRYMRGHIGRLGADTVYMIHNHTAGDPTPSIADLAATAYVFGKIPQLIGHIIINFGKYAFIVPDGTSYNVSPLHDFPADWIDPILQPSIRHHLLGRIAKGTNQIAAWTEALTRDNHGPVLIYLDERLRVRGLQRAHTKMFFDKALTPRMINLPRSSAVLPSTRRSFFASRCGGLCGRKDGDTRIFSSSLLLR